MTNPSLNQVNLRNLVLSMLIETEAGGKSHIVLKKCLDDYNNLDKQQRSFMTMLYEGTIERQIELDYIINCYSKTKTDKMKPVIRNILRMSVYQLKYMDSVPESAVCNEAVKLTQKRKFVNLKGFVNGVLRTIARNIDNVEYPSDYIANLSVRYSIPEWIISMWNGQYGKDRTEEMLNALYENKPTTVRCNDSKATVDDIVASLEYQGVKVDKSELYDKALFLSKYDSLNSLDVFKAGMITVQDLSSMLVSLVALPKKDDYVIDVCAAPGGKSMHIAEMLNGAGLVDSRDLTAPKVRLIEQNIKRMGYKNVTAKVWDATQIDEEAIGKADIVIADVPCSGLGVLGNKSDIKYRVTKKQTEELVALQRKIVETVSAYVKPGGKLVYSTCTVNKQENDDNVSWIKNNLPLKLIFQDDKLPKQLQGRGDFLQVFPGEYGMDGFFIASFIKE